MKIITITIAMFLLIHLIGYGQIEQKLLFEDQFYFEKTNIDGNSYTSINISELHKPNVKGVPQLPLKSIKIIVPSNATNLWIETNQVKTEEFICEFPILPGYDSFPTDTAVTIEGHTLQAGMYLFTLIADGKEVDTKKMILIK